MASDDAGRRAAVRILRAAANGGALATHGTTGEGGAATPAADHAPGVRSSVVTKAHRSGRDREVACHNGGRHPARQDDADQITPGREVANHNGRRHPARQNNAGQITPGREVASHNGGRHPGRQDDAR
jgi:hypothetical protein